MAAPESVLELTEEGRAQQPVVEQLERALDLLEAQLREDVDEYEASTEELKAGNEELSAMNEELRGATQELESSREELQSINEELSTVHVELKSKLDELSHANSDLRNLMSRKKPRVSGAQQRPARKNTRHECRGSAQRVRSRSGQPRRSTRVEKPRRASSARVACLLLEERAMDPESRLCMPVST